MLDFRNIVGFVFTLGLKTVSIHVPHELGGKQLRCIYL